MIEKVLLDYLSQNLKVPVYMEEPPEKEKEFVLLEKIGGTKHNKLCSSSFAIQSYGSTLFKAAVLNEKVVDVFENAVILDDVCSIRLNSNYNFPDLETKRYRYQAVFDITHY